MLSIQTPWYADIVNYLACGVMPFEFSYQQMRKLRTDYRLYIWDDPLLYRRGADMIIRKCVLETEHGGIMEKCHDHTIWRTFFRRQDNLENSPIRILLAYSIQRLF